MAGLVTRAVRGLASWRPGPAASRRSSIALGVLLMLVCAGAVVASRAISAETLKADRSAAASDQYQDARFYAALEDAELNEYLATAADGARSEFSDAANQLTASLNAIQATEDAPAISNVTDEQRQYLAQADKVFTLVGAGKSTAAEEFQQFQAEPIFLHMTTDIAVLEETHHKGSVAQLKAVRKEAAALQAGTPLVLGLVVLLLAGLSYVTRAYRRSVEQQALHDSLTGLPNRLLFSRRAAAAVTAAGNGSCDPLVIMLDLDRFKEVNDTLGHHHGDQLLIEVAARISGVLRPADVVARLGGDEFAVLLGEGGSDAGTRVGQRIADALEPSFYLDGVTVSVEASMGVAALSQATDSTAGAPPAERAAELLRQADIAMYEAKMQRSGIATFRTGTEGAPPARLALLGELRDALNRDELVLHYQPKVGADSGRLLGVEALVRWNHPTRGLLAPAEFIGLAEGTTLIQRLTAIVVEKALATSRSWLDRGVRLPVAVNVSARCLLDDSFPDMITSQLLLSGVPADHLCLELTESTIMADPNRALATMQDLRALGVRLSVDDFGTGYSSMAYLKILPVDELKVDRSFVSQMTSSADDTMLVQSAIDLGHNLGMSVVAEGVEDAETLITLKDLGADVIQGYYLGHPMDGDLLEQWVLARPASQPEPAVAQPAVQPATHSAPHPA
jgi:diguanylate cyclase (GGDEF)-like protein